MPISHVQRFISRCHRGITKTSRQRAKGGAGTKAMTGISAWVKSPQHSRRRSAILAVVMAPRASQPRCPQSDALSWESLQSERSWSEHASLKGVLLARVRPPGLHHRKLALASQLNHLLRLKRLEADLANTRDS